MARIAIRRSLTAVVASAGLLLVAPGVANADDWVWNDGFEKNPASVWEFDWGGHFDINEGSAWTGRNNASLPVNSDFVSVRTTLAIPGGIFRGSGYNCVAYAMVRSVGVIGVDYSDVNFEILDEPSWTYMALQNYRIPAGGGWREISTGYWSSGDEHPALRVSLLKSPAALLVDDVTVMCSSWLLI